jgi:UDP-glucose 4-epimerase
MSAGRILVTGGTGFIGSNISRTLVEQGRNVVVYGKSAPSGHHVLTDVLDRLKIEIGNVTDLSNLLRIIKNHGVEGIINCAAFLGAAANQRPIEALQVNIIGAANMLEAARIADLRRVVITSSGGVTGAPQDLLTPRKEEDICLPLVGIYPLSKLTAEQLVHTYRQLYKVDAIAIRPYTIFGPGLTRPYHPIVPVVEAAARREPIHYETGGDTAFDLTYVKDFVKGAIGAYDCRSPRYYLYNVSFGRNRTMFQVCDVLKQLFPELPIKMGSGLWGGVLTKGEQTDLTYRMSQRPPQDITRARQDFNFEPEWDLDRAIPDWIQWIQRGKY